MIDILLVLKQGDGMTVEQIEEKCKGIHCGFKSTSCADQLACAAREAYEAEKKQK